jgi:hypothetical protein
MWFLALVVGVVLAALLTHLAKRVFLSGRKTTGRLIAFVRWPAWFACVWWCFGLVRHEAAGHAEHRFAGRPVKARRPGVARFGRA